MGNFPFNVPSLGNKFQDLRGMLAGDSFNWSWVRPLTQVRYLVIHHTAGPDNQTPQEIANYHVQSRGWGGIGYHFLIAKDGTTYYVGDLTTARANVANLNEQVIGICLIGNFTNGQLPSNNQISSTHELLSQLLFRTPELTNVTSWSDVTGHKQLNATECPGDTWDNWKNQVINVVVRPGNNDRASQITELYNVILGRAPDSAGLQSYVSGNLTIDQIRKAMTESDEHKQILARAANFKNAQSLSQEAQNLIAQGYWKLDDVSKLV